jgi:threonine dehydratase
VLGGGGGGAGAVVAAAVLEVVVEAEAEVEVVVMLVLGNSNVHYNHHKFFVDILDHNYLNKIHHMNVIKSYQVFGSYQHRLD